MDSISIMLVIPIVILELGLKFAAFMDLSKREKVTGGNKVVWAIIILVFQALGPIAYFVFGRREQ